jgi:L-lactate dehydrogenase (cytochrome)/(S)-mandelate dehydrogenase
MFDSGIRRGADVIIARCLGAQFVFVGRATLYGVVAGGEQGVARAIEILRQEIDLGLALVGCPNFQDLGPEYLIASLAGSPSGQARAAVPAKAAPPRNTPRSPPNLFLVPS